MTDYWTECIETAADECGLLLTAEQLECLAGAAESGHQYYGQAYPSQSPSLDTETERLRRELKQERDKVMCPECRGTGVEIVYFSDRVSRSECYRCRGKGRVLP